jgi:hypothetical protein
MAEAIQYREDFVIETIERMIGDLECGKLPSICCLSRHAGSRRIRGAGCARNSSGAGRLPRCEPEPRHRAGS